MYLYYTDSYMIFLALNWYRVKRNDVLGRSIKAKFLNLSGEDSNEHLILVAVLVVRSYFYLHFVITHILEQFLNFQLPGYK